MFKERAVIWRTWRWCNSATKIRAKKTTHSQSKCSRHLQFIRWKQLQRNRIYEQRWCFGKALWLSWYKENLVELRASVATGRQRKCDTISGRISFLAPNSRANTFQLYFDNDIMDKLVDCRNTRIIKTIACLQRSDNFNESSKYTWVKKNQMTDRLFSNDSHLVL